MNLRFSFKSFKDSVPFDFLPVTHKTGMQIVSFNNKPSVRPSQYVQYRAVLNFTELDTLYHDFNVARNNINLDHFELTSSEPIVLSAEISSIEKLKH